MAPRVLQSDALSGREKLWITYDVALQRTEIHYLSEEDAARADRGERMTGEKVRLFDDYELTELRHADIDVNDWLAKQAEQFAYECRQYERKPQRPMTLPIELVGDEPFPGYATRRPRDEELEYIPDVAVLPDPPARRKLSDLSMEEREAKRQRISELFTRGFGNGAEVEED